MPLFAQFGDEIEDHLAGLRVQARAGLVEEQDLRIADQRRGEGEALFLPAGQAPHVGAAEGVDAQAPDQLIHRPRVLVHAGDVPQQGDGPGRRRQAAVLQHHAHAGAEPRAGRIRVLAE